jgi:2-C-methyl-D-erythritol 4-phosphate cytidylyltransferase/2-C-methyl-D-erythritol 2,4-cyclodiphosphate synthase
MASGHIKSTLALIVAAGTGTRFGGNVPKQYLDLGGISVLRRTVEAFLAHPRVTVVRVVIQPAHEALYRQAVEGLALPDPVHGAASRQASTLNGLEACAGEGFDTVLIHDAVRPFIDTATIDRVLDAVEDGHSAVPGLAVADTLRRDIGGFSGGTVDRTALWRMQTPQGFAYQTILAAHRAAPHDRFTDDAAIVEAAGYPVRLVQGHVDNIKVTVPEDMVAAERKIMGQYEFRTGMGFDVHEFGPGTSIMICGVEVPHDRTAIGHSDADVGLHALTDALLGSIGAGDIGTYFPPSDMRWKGADSATFLRHAASLVTDKGGRIVNVDLTLLCERPKIGPHRDAMIARIADILGLSRERVAVKATTTEKLGFLGRSEGIAGQAVATIRMPVDE